VIEEQQLAQQPTLAEWMRQIRGALASDGAIRIELGLTISLTHGSMPSARIWVRNAGTNRWETAGPLLLAPEGKDQWELLHLIADMGALEHAEHQHG